MSAYCWSNASCARRRCGYAALSGSAALWRDGLSGSAALWRDGLSGSAALWRDGAACEGSISPRTTDAPIRPPPPVSPRFRSGVADVSPERLIAGAARRRGGGVALRVSDSRMRIAPGRCEGGLDIRSNRSTVAGLTAVDGRHGEMRYPDTSYRSGFDTDPAEPDDSSCYSTLEGVCGEQPWPLDRLGRPPSYPSSRDGLIGLFGPLCSSTPNRPWRRKGDRAGNPLKGFPSLPLPKRL